MSDTSESRIPRIETIPGQRTLTRAEAEAAQARFEELWADYEAKRTHPPDPFDYYVYKGLWQRAHGAESIVVVD